MLQLLLRHVEREEKKNAAPAPPQNVGRVTCCTLASNEDMCNSSMLKMFFFDVRTLHHGDCRVYRARKIVQKQFQFP